MAAAERLFSLELLVDWLRLQAGPPAPRAPGPAVAFRLPGFPPLLVRAPAAPAPGARRGAIGFGRGKACLFRLRPADRRRLRLRAALLQPPGPQPLGTCDIPLELGAAGRRGTFALRSPAGRRVGDVALLYRLTDLGASTPGPPAPRVPAPRQRPPAGDRHDVRPQTRRPRSAPELRPSDWDAPAAAPHGGGKEGAPRGGRRPDPAEAAGTPRGRPDPAEAAGTPRGRPDPAEAAGTPRGRPGVARCAAGSERRGGPLKEDVPGLEFGSNTFCPPPLYYTNLTPEKRLPAPREICIEPQMSAPEESDTASLGKAASNPPARPSPLGCTNLAAQGRPPVGVSPPCKPHTGTVHATACPQTDQNIVSMVRQLPLLNALFIELSLLYSQPVASPTHIHPHLAWLYRPQDKEPGSSTKSTESASSEDQLSADELKAVSVNCEKSQTQSLGKGKGFEKGSRNPPKRVTKGKLLYGMTNTLRLRLRQTNPGMLAVHEKREHCRKMQAQVLGTKLRILPSKVQVLSFAEQSQKPKGKCSGLDVSLVGNSGASRQVSGVCDEPRLSKDTNLKHAAEKKTVNCVGKRTGSDWLGGAATRADPGPLEGHAHTGTSGGKLEGGDQRPRALEQDVVGRTVDRDRGGRQVQTTDSDILVGRNENSPSKNSISESTSELKYSDDFTSPYYSEDFYTPEETSKSWQAGSSSRAQSPECSPCPSRCSEAKLPVWKNGSEKNSILSPPFSAGSPEHSRRSHVLKTQGRSLEEARSSSASDLSSHWTKEKERQVDQHSMHSSEATGRGKDITVTTRASCKSFEKSQSLQTSQVSSYLPSNLSELELKVLNSSTSDHFEDDDDIEPLSISKQCKDICELVINKLPGYTM
ncbi:microtubule-associated protein 10 [Ctenodactylus gundi]